MSNLKLVAGTVKRRGIAIAAAVAVAGGSLATANYAMAAEAEPTFDELKTEFSGTEAGNTAAKTVQEAKLALKDKASDDQLLSILKNGLKSAAADSDGGFTEEDLKQFDEGELESQLKAVVNSARQTLAEKGASQDEQPAAPAAQALVQSPEAKWATPAPEGNPSPQRLEAEFGNTTEGKIAEETAKKVAEVIRTTGNKQEIQSAVHDGLKKAGFNDSEIEQHKTEIDDIIAESFRNYNTVNAELQHEKQSALTQLASLDKLNPLQRDIFKKQIESAKNKNAVMTVLTAANAEQKNPVAPFAPVPGQKAPEKTGEKTDVEKALTHTKKEALEKLKGFTSLTQQQKDAYIKAVDEATEVYQVEAAFETGEAKNKVNEEAKKAKGFLAKAIARTKHLALEKLDGFQHLTHEQKKEARKKILDADQVYQVEAAFHAAEKLNKATK
ncbi:GA module-containing protein [Corynebacterium propinquum]|uniref:GA module-containing protein n=1 Tax=Corynebacterium propinquum TaxID=43769 RepID=UPI0025430768|nr:GA module-containing protein [Corynebacterium propinquum]MDK4252944.1 GA module-containing protein [Corynebacterium propinquum]